ncbi:hypothetical protein BDQ94DRAFT_143305 [Aspergillus welwitschiae]|uniref:Uncharacterized protein n=1 Tax=Aspergillus welwitschiae TaxID=1341132 RepID=A0A3F3Q4C1_9EURO|nr:hypothetical protein BDQ94DRAFT_143305 [Aspergillus welwitschiae]RDH33546.1 hypothetical protein BDQ94DRAFT_143305 [Aspergillus welwitschiae]
MSIGNKAERNAMMTFMPVSSNKPRSPLSVALWPVTRDHPPPSRYISPLSFYLDRSSISR